MQAGEEDKVAPAAALGGDVLLRSSKASNQSERQDRTGLRRIGSTNEAVTRVTEQEERETPDPCMHACTAYRGGGHALFLFSD